MNNLNVDVVLVNYHTVQRVVDIALKYSSFNIINKVIIVNNDTNDKERKTLSALRDSKIEVIFESENLGYSKGNNLGITYLINSDTKPDYIIISNSDVEVEEITIKGVIEKLEQFPEFGAMAPKQLDSAGNIVPLRFFELGYKRLLLLCFAIGLDKKTEKYLKEYADNIYEQSFLHGSFFICRTQAFIDCDMFDTEIFLYREEEILGKRMNSIGYKLAVINNLYYKHTHKSSEEKLLSFIKQRKLEFTSERYFFRKYLNASKLQIIYVYILEKLMLCRLIIKHIILKL